MAPNEPSSAPSHCLSCGFEAEAGADEWDSIDAPSLGALTRCPECGSTDVRSGL